MNKKSDAIAPLKKIQFMGTNDPTVCGFQVTDSQDRSFTTGINAAGIAFVVERLMEQASHPGFREASEFANPAPSECRAAGSRIEWGPGRSADEVEATLAVGCIKLAVFFPLSEVERSFAQLRQDVEKAAQDTAP